MTRYDILDAAHAFLRALNNASDSERNAAYQVIANRANDSDYGQAAEPYSGLCVAFQAHEKRLVLDAKEADAECSGLIDGFECSDCDASNAVEFIGPYTVHQERQAFLVQCVECGSVEPVCYAGDDSSDHATRRAESGYAQ